MKWFRALALVASLLPAPLFAADLNRNIALKAPPLEELYCIWCGFYMGINGGYGWGNGTVTATGLDLNTQRLFAGAQRAGFPFSFRDSPSGGEAGFEGGYNYVVGPVVLGVDADAQWSDLSGSKNSVFKVNPITTLTDQVNQRIEGFGTLRGTLGCACGTFMPYLTAGAVVADVSTSGAAAMNVSRGVVPTAAAINSLTFSSQTNSDQFRGGWVWGGGIAWQPLPRWIVKAEYLNLNLGSQNQLVTPAGLDINLASRLDNISIARLSVDYIFPINQPLR
jgi:outer membrane immunogenic protein